MGRRADLLAARIEQGATELATFVKGISDVDWKKPVSKTDTRTIGQIVNHVALVYPIEIDLAQKIGSGTPVTEVTWEVVADLNANHAREHSGVTKDQALDLLRKNSKAAAESARQFTDQQLDTAAPFGLSYNAPVTAQFVLEDHAVRHSWHHLAKLRKALGR